MAEFLKTFQTAAGSLTPMVLWAGGGLLVWLGLFLWLGGLRWLKFFAAIAAAAIGYWAAFSFTDRQLHFLIGIPVLAALLAIFFEKTVVVLLAGIFVGLVVNLVMVWPTLADAKTWQNPPAVTVSGQGDVITQSLTLLEDYAEWVQQNIYNAAKSLGTVTWIVYGVAVLAVAGIGLLLPRGICAMLCSVLGVLWIAVGMFFLLVYKGSTPADIVLEKPGMFGMIAAGMILFGILINLAFAPAKPRKKAVQQPAVEKQ